MKKEGFTLIELLAVILILGIITLIAIPIVTKITDEARIKAFKETNQNIATAVEDKCSTLQLKGQNDKVGYSFTSDGSSDELDVKGKLPTGGSVVADSSCKSIVYTNNNKYCAIKAAGTDEVTVGKIVDGKCSIVMEKESFCNKDSEPGTLNGTGTTESPYLIESVEDLMKFKQMVYDDSYHLANKFVKLNVDIDFKNDCSYANSSNTTYGDVNGDGTTEGLMKELTTGKGFEPISEYYGSFDGGNHYISNLYINRNNDQTALFSRISVYDYYSNSIIFKNINIINADITSGSSSAVLVGYAYDNQDGDSYKITMNNIQIIGEISASGGSVGLILGQNYSYNNSKFTNFITMGSVEGNGSYIGGAIGYSSNSGDYENILNYASVEGKAGYNNYVGGIIGRTQDPSILKNLYNYGNVVTTAGSSGGVVGYIPSSSLEVYSTMTNIYNYGNVTGKNSYVGGIVGQTGKLNGSNIYNYGNVSNTSDYSGGVFGNYGYGTLTNVYNYGDVSAKNYTGGIVGQLYGYSSVNVTNLANYGNISGQYNAGGLFGEAHNATISNSLNQADLNIVANNSNYQTGGLIGGGNSVNISNSYSIGDINIEINNAYVGYAGGAFGCLSGTATNIYVLSNMNIDNKSTATEGYISGIVGVKYPYDENTLSLNNVYYKGNVTNNLPSLTISTIYNGASITLNNVFYNSNNTNFNVTNGATVNNSNVTATWFKDVLNLGNNFDYSNGLYPRLYFKDSTTLINDQQKINL